MPISYFMNSNNIHIDHTLLKVLLLILFVIGKIGIIRIIGIKYYD